MSEIEFITLMCDDRSSFSSTLVIYAGAAPGTHIPMVAGLFPGVEFVLVDPARFTCQPSQHIQIRRTMMTNELCIELKTLAANQEKRILFISDIRAADHTRESQSENEQNIRNDMAVQMEWHKILRPVSSMLKFRLPWTEGNTEYLDGEIHLPVWGPTATTEARLITPRKVSADEDDVPEMREYDNKKYESQMMHFNVCTRVAIYPHAGAPTGHIAGAFLCHCYDCSAETHILHEYLKKFPSHIGQDLGSMEEQIRDLSQWASRACSTERTLMDPNPEKEHRKRIIDQRQKRLNGEPYWRPNTTAANDSSKRLKA